MKCTGNKKIRAAALAAASMLFLCSCGQKTYELEHPYDVYGTSIHYAQPSAGENNTDGSIPFFADGLCVAADADSDIKVPGAQTAEAAGVFHLNKKTVPYSKNLYKKLYPASTTKILTAYVAIRHANLSEIVTVSAQAASQAGDSSVCGLKAGDRLTLLELLYGLLGATHSNFVNPHGLHDDNHYTCVYDLYLLLNAALKEEMFTKVIQTDTHRASYTNANGGLVVQEWETTDKFLNGEEKAPDGVNVIGGKTGTTNAAGYCLALYSNNAAGEPVISIVLKADSSDSLYGLMGELLKL